MPPSASADTPIVIIEPRKGWRLIDWREVKEYRDLLYFLVLRDVTVLYKQTVLGIAWAVLTPFFSMVVFSIIFGRLIGVPSDGVPYPIFSFAALLPWTYFANSLTGSTGSLISGTGLFTKVYFPRVFIPLVPVLSKLVDFAIASSLLALLMVWYGIVPSANVLLLPIPILLMILTSAGIGMGLSALAIQFRDVRHAMGFAVTLLQYAAPVVWPASKIPEEFRLWYGLYPMAGVIEGFRAAILNTGPMPWDLIGMGGLSATLCFVAGAMYFRRTERVFADVA
ncbi:MAG: ABC transporter permease [Verrucomicrobiae bacterium]|nr:ABC transporter permease [Verrucomicrobiae bacterium]